MNFLKPTMCCTILFIFRFT